MKAAVQIKNQVYLMTVEVLDRETGKVRCENNDYPDGIIGRMGGDTALLAKSDGGGPSFLLLPE